MGPLFIIQSSSLNIHNYNPEGSRLMDKDCQKQDQHRTEPPVLILLQTNPFETIKYSVAIPTLMFIHQIMNRTTGAVVQI
jgi:hypothetical protein